MCSPARTAWHMRGRAMENKPLMNLWRALTASVVIAVACASCTTSTQSSSSTTGLSKDGASGTGTASARGVTADTIRIGFTYPDLQALSKTGIVKIDNGPSGDLMKAIVDDFNAHNRIYGRKLELFNSAWFPIGNDKQLASCIQLTEDHAVFAVLGGYLGANNLCVTEQHNTALIGRDTDAVTTISQSTAPWISYAPTADRATAGLVHAMQRNGDLAGHTVAVIGQAIDKPLIDAATKALADLGVTAAYVAVYEGDGSDVPQLTAEDGVFEQRLRAKHVDTVIDVSGYIPLNSFTKDDYLPKIFALSPAAVIAAAATAPHSSFPFVGTITANGDANQLYDDPVFVHCREAWKAATGKTIETPAEETKAGKSSGGAGMTDACALLQVFVAAARAAGPNLTNDTLRKGAESLGRLDVPGIGTATFRPGKLDGQNSFQLIRLNKDWTTTSTVQEFTPVGGTISINS